MIISCGQCLAKFKVAPEQIKISGSKVRCSNCQHVFTVYRPGFDPDEREIDRQALPYNENTSDFDEGGEDYANFGDSSESYDDDDYGDYYDYEDDDDDHSLEKQEGEAYFSARYLEDEETIADDLSPKERRDRRRELYADIADEVTVDGEEEYYIDYDDNLADKDKSNTLEKDAPSYEDEFDVNDEQYDDENASDDDDDDEYDEDYDDYDYNDYDDDEDYDDVPSKNERKASLGLAADPVDHLAYIEDDEDYPASNMAANNSANARAAVSKASVRSSKVLIIFIAIILLTLILGFIFSKKKPPNALSGGQNTTENSSIINGGGIIAIDDTDREGIKHITFARDTQNHYFRQNREGEQILIITGMVRNSYPEPRSFIRLRGHIIDSAGNSLADRFVYAGNIISEGDLQSLPPAEILIRLSLQGGQEGRNMNIAPNAEVPFMVVFDKLPDGMAEYRIDPVGSSPGDI